MTGWGTQPEFLQSVTIPTLGHAGFQKLHADICDLKYNVLLEKTLIMTSHFLINLLLLDIVRLFIKNGYGISLDPHNNLG